MAKVAAHSRATFKLTPQGTNDSVSISGIVDTGEQSMLWDWNDFGEAGKMF